MKNLFSNLVGRRCRAAQKSALAILASVFCLLAPGLRAAPTHVIYDARNFYSSISLSAPLNSSITIQPWPIPNSVGLYGVGFVAGPPVTLTPTNTPGGTNAIADFYLFP